MFCCPSCHDLRKHEFEMFRSYGRCEMCGKTRSCIDCHLNDCNPPKKPAKKKVTKRK